MTKVIPLIDYNKYKIPYDNRCLKIVYEATAKGNYEKALIRNKIKDYNGALNYCYYAIDLDKNFKPTYFLLERIYAALRDFNEIVNLAVFAMKQDVKVELLGDNLSGYYLKNYSNDEIDGLADCLRYWRKYYSD